MIDITTLTKKQLIQLNEDIVERIKFLQRQETVSKMSAFNLMDLVILGSGANKQYAIITKINQKTIGIVCEDGQHWRVSPAMIAKTTLTPAKAREFIKKKFPELGALDAMYPLQ